MLYCGNIHTPSDSSGIDVETERGHTKLFELRLGLQVRGTTEVGTTALSDKHAATTKGNLETAGFNIETNLAGIHGPQSQAKMGDQSTRPSLPDNSEGAALKKNENSVLEKHCLVSTREGKLPDPGSTTIKGHFPPGTNLEMSTPNGVIKIVTKHHSAVVSTVTSGEGSFQFLGDSASGLSSALDLYLKRGRSID
jgi:hypothetical protein